ncbi:primosomal replication protein PriC [Catenovulum sediminis]|uniref:Primosomal replication protein PriC n=1 Tax=Catenovulum sediminis TaxID=1740262 RepID=A0ABV1REN7_9ALTE|nr:primosomal replication protein PriC [Catenovulum sediminis]
MPDNLRQKTENMLQQISDRLMAQPRKQKIVSLLQYHSSFVCQSENLQDYIDECKKLIDAAFRPNANERVFDKLNDQLELLSKYAIKDKLQDDEHATEYRSRAGKLHKRLAEYRQYLARFDDQIRSQPNLPADHSLFQRRERCQQAINKLEEQISRIEVGYIRY